MTILRFLEEFLAMGYRIGLEHVGGGVYTEITIQQFCEPGGKYLDLFVENVPSNHLRDPIELDKLKSEISAKL